MRPSSWWWEIKALSAIVTPGSGRCQELIDLLADGGGFEGFTQTIFRFADEVAIAWRLRFPMQSGEAPVQTRRPSAQLNSPL